MALEMDAVLSMSLDDYIAKASSSNAGSVGRSSNSSGKNTFKARNHKHNVDDDDEEEDVELTIVADMNADDGIEEVARIDDDAGSAINDSIWRGPDANTRYIDLESTHDDLSLYLTEEDRVLQRNESRGHQAAIGSAGRGSNFDLREKINGPVPNRNSQQWRLMRPNNECQRPAGMPPLVPMDTPLSNPNRQWHNRNKRQRNRWGRWGHRGAGAGYNNGGNYFGDFSNAWAQNGNRFNGIGEYNNGRIQRFNQRNSLESLNVAAVLDRVNCSGMSNNNSSYNELGVTPKFQVASPGNAIKLANSPMYALNSSCNVGNAQIQVEPNADEAIMSNASSNVNNNLRALLGIKDSLNREDMPTMASKLLDFLRSGSQDTIHKPIYDMKVQKRIHEIQKKPLMYKCPGGEVVSSDGAGLNDIQVTPRTSGVSMNYRFA